MLSPKPTSVKAYDMVREDHNQHSVSNMVPKFPGETCTLVLRLLAHGRVDALERFARISPGVLKDLCCLRLGLGLEPKPKFFQRRSWKGAELPVPTAYCLEFTLVRAPLCCKSLCCASRFCTSGTELWPIQANVHWACASARPLQSPKSGKPKRP